MIKRRVKVLVSHNFKDAMQEMHGLKRGTTIVLTFKNVLEFKNILALNKLKELPMKAPMTRERTPVADLPPDKQDADTAGEGEQEVEVK